MADDVLIDKAATIERCVRRAREEYAKDPARRLQNLVGYRNIAVHEYQALQLPITVAVITTHLEDFLVYSAALLRGR